MGFNATLVTATPNTIIHAADFNTNFTNLNSVNQMYDGTDTTHVIGFSLHGSSDAGISVNGPVAVVGSSLETIIKVNNFFSTADKFFVASTGALQLRFSATGISARVSTNTPTVNGNITWGAETFLYGS